MVLRSISSHIMPKDSPRNKEPGPVQPRIDLFSGCEFARMMGFSVIEAREGYARICMAADGKRNPHGVIHGGAIFTLADQAFALAANTGGSDRVAVSANIQFIAPASGDLEAVATYVGNFGKYFTYRIVITEGKRLIAVFDGTSLQISP